MQKFFFPILITEKYWSKYSLDNSMRMFHSNNNNKMDESMNWTTRIYLLLTPVSEEKKIKLKLFSSHTHNIHLLNNNNEKKESKNDVFNM